MTCTKLLSPPSKAGKLYKPTEKANIDIRFDTSVLLKVDKTSQAEYFKSLVLIGAMTINEVRKALDLPALENGDNSFVQVNTMTLKNAVKETIVTNTKQNDGIKKQ